MRSITAAFNEMAQALQDRIERDARFASDVSHELRSPLMTLAASVEVMDNQREDLPERARAALDLMVGDIEFVGLDPGALGKFAGAVVIAGIGRRDLHTGVLERDTDRLADPPRPPGYDRHSRHDSLLLLVIERR
jgi:signal transduction histidine kinase